MNGECPSLQFLLGKGTNKFQLPGSIRNGECPSLQFLLGKGTVNKFQLPGSIRNECRLSSSFLGMVRLISSSFQEVSGIVNAVSPVPTWERYG